METNKRQHVTTLPVGGLYRTEPTGPILEVVSKGPDKIYVRVQGSTDLIGMSVALCVGETHPSVHVIPVEDLTPLYTLIAATQRTGKIVAIVDTRAVLDTERAIACGVALADLLISQPDNATQAAEIAATLTRTGAIGMLLVI